MVFSSITFLFYFLPAFGLLYFAAPRGLKNPVLLFFSLLFYAWGEPLYVLLLLISIALNFTFGMWVERGRAAGRRLPIVLAIVANLALLGYFKYFGFIANSLGALGLIGPAGLAALPHPRLPLGISFFTFHAISYLVDVWRGPQRAERDPVALAVYIAMFPQLIAGPIVRYKTIAAALHQRSAGIIEIRAGFERFIIGLARKTLIANPLGATADKVFALDAGDLTAPVAWVGALAYTGQIYLDFAGYSNMAIGLAQMLGFKFPENFNFPYVSRSITEFWRRWHMSLSAWFRDYVYIPLGGNRRGAASTYFNLFAVFFLCGLWHGAQWTFVVWGLYHGALLVAERVGLAALLARAPAAVGHIYALLAVVLGWVLFRAQSFEAAAVMLKAMAGLGAAKAGAPGLSSFLSMDVALAFLLALAVSGPWILRLARLAARATANLSGALNYAGGLATLRTASAAALLLASAAFLAVGTYNPFIYFRF